MSRGPIDAMIDSACGVPNGAQQHMTAPAPRLPPDETTQALVLVADRAKAWNKARARGKHVAWHEGRLAKAVDALVALGW